MFLFINQIKDIPILIVSNRDEFKNRKSTPINGWNKQFNILGNDIIAPRDEFKNGTWFACQNKKNPKWAILTNIRDLKSLKDGLSTRGNIVLDFINSSDTAEKYLEKLNKISDKYNYFNLIFSDNDSIYYFHSKNKEFKLLYKKSNQIKNIFGLSNGELNADWPKVTYTKATFLNFFEKNTVLRDSDFYWNYFKNEMMNSNKYPLSSLPNTGVSPEQEVFLSSLFIEGEKYGTNSTILFGIEKSGSIFFYEQTYDLNSRIDISKKIQLKFYDHE